jgi:hypothetical protein
VFHNFNWKFGYVACLQYSFHKSSGLDKKKTDWTFAQTICTNLKQTRTSLNYLLQVLRHVYRYNVKTQQHSLQWRPKSFPKLKKSMTQQIKCEDNALVLNVEILCTMSSFLRGQTVKQEFHLLTVLQHLKRLCKKWPELQRENRWFIHHNNPPAHTVFSVLVFFTKNRTPVIP